MSDLPGPTADTGCVGNRQADHTAIFCRFADALASLIAAARLRAIQRRSA